MIHSKKSPCVFVVINIVRDNPSFFVAYFLFTQEFILNHFSIKIDQDEFAFNRFLTHLRYYLKRIQSSEISDGEVNPNLLATFKKESPEVYACTQQIVNFVDGRYHTATSDDEMFYLMVYVNRIVRKSTCTEEGEE
ncbi:PRD domain-containing protein [Lactobacillus delbrueckii]|uniref:PRD domain-containing protein n=1 Tax=Lactobacillus delbrueckii TaxID=1584 RepID=UPI00358DA976